jgi:hypothetical protein
MKIKKTKKISRNKRMFFLILINSLSKKNVNKNNPINNIKELK